MTTLRIAKSIKTILFCASIFLIFNIFSLKTHAQIISITRDKSVNIELTAERSSDLNYKIYYSSLDQTIIEEYLRELTVTNSSDGKSNENIKLERNGSNKKDEEDGNCISTIESRRIGICNDGIYKIEITSFDAAGNRSNPVSHTIERDTVSPELPKVSDPYLCDDQICIKIQGEENSFLYINQKQTEVINKFEEKEYFLVKNWSYDKKYTFEVYLTDKAGNVSEIVSKSIKTPKPVLSRGGIDEASEDNPYSGKSADNFSPITFDVNLKYGESYQISNINIPAPVLTYVHTSDTLAKVYGVSISKYHPLKPKIIMQYLTYNEAEDYCDVGFYIHDNDKKCIEQAMGITSLTDFENNILLRCSPYVVIPPGNLICAYNIKKNERITKEIQSESFQAQHVNISLHKESGDDITNLWNDSENGRFVYDLKVSEEVNIGDYVKAKVRIFGDFEIDGNKIDYRGISSSDARNNSGLQSDFSNSLLVEKPEFINIGNEQAKVLDVPYFNQWLEPDGSYFPPDGWQMCGAASSVMVAAYFDKLEYDKNDTHSLKKYMYSDSGQGITESCGENKGGAFGLTNYGCDQSWNVGVIKYLEHHNLNWDYLAGAITDNQGVGVLGADGTQLYAEITFEKIAAAIDRGHPVILSFNGYDIGHITVIKGYTSNRKLVMSDSFKDVQNSIQGGYSYNGKNALYDLNSAWNILYAFEVSK